MYLPSLVVSRKCPRYVKHFLKIFFKRLHSKHKALFAQFGLKVDLNPIVVTNQTGLQSTESSSAKMASPGKNTKTNQGMTW